MNRNPNTPNPQPSSSSSDESGPLPFGNFDDSDFMATPESDDRALVAFLKQHQPIAPPEPANFEADLMAAIAQEPLPVTDMAVIQKPKRWRMVVGAIAAGLVGAALGHNLGAWTNPGMRLADPGTTTTPDAELELFLENGWDGAIAQTDSTDSTFGWETSDEM